jgi:hypothetical protein
MNNEMSDPQIDEYYTIVKELEKFDTFTNFLDVHQPELAIVFGSLFIVLIIFGVFMNCCTNV